MPAIVEADIPALFIEGVLEADATLMALTITDYGGTARAIQGVHFMAVPQESVNAYPCIIINSPYELTAFHRIRPLGPNLYGASFGVDVRVAARDVEPNQTDLQGVRARIRLLLEGQAGPVVGGRATSIWIEGFIPPQRLDRGAYVYSEIGLTFGVGAQVS